MDGESVLNAGSNGLVLANVSEAHVLAIPLEHFVQALETYCEHTHHNHLVEGACLPQRSQSYTCDDTSLSLQAVHPVHLMANLYAACHLRSVGLATREQPWVLSVTSADERVLCSMEDGQATTGLHQLFALWEAFWTVGHQAAVIPVNSTSGMPTFGILSRAGNVSLTCCAWGAHALRSSVEEPSTFVG